MGMQGGRSAVEFKGRRQLQRSLLCAVAALCLGGTLWAQQAAAGSQNDQPQKGFTSYVEMGGSAGSEGHVLQLTTDAGYQFSQHVNVNFGVPFYFVGGSTTSSTGKTSYSTSGVGAPFAALQLTFNGNSVNYGTGLTLYLPAGNTSQGLSTGRTSFDWNNRLEHSFSRLTPFAEAGFGDTVLDSAHFHRPYTSYGYNAHFQGGAEVQLADKVSVGASVYDIAPWGTQTVYSRTTPHASSAAAAASSKGAANNRFFDSNGITSGGSDISKDDGFSTWLDFSPAPILQTEVGYTRSVHFALNTVSFTVRLDVGKLARQAGARQ